jgi:hypothetical protein
MTPEEARAHRDQTYDDRFAYGTSKSPSTSLMKHLVQVLVSERDIADAGNEDYVHIQMIDNDNVGAHEMHAYKTYGVRI